MMDRLFPGNRWFVRTRGPAKQNRWEAGRSQRRAARVVHPQSVLAAGLALVLVACTPASTSAAASRTATEPTSACRGETFDVFIQRFSRDIASQQLATADPLIVERYDATAEPEPRKVVEEVASADVIWPVMPRLDPLTSRGSASNIIRIADNRMEVQVRTPDTSDQQRYVFGQSPCWQLQRVVDESI